MSGTGIYKHTAGHVSVPAEGGRRQSQAQEVADIGSTDPGRERREAAGVTLSLQRLLYLRHLSSTVNNSLTIWGQRVI